VGESAEKNGTEASASSSTTASSLTHGSNGNLPRYPGG
jgi:hypothetical protein